MVVFLVVWEKNRILNHLSQNIVGDEHTTANAFAQKIQHNNTLDI
jgi:hypothetical protein